MSNLQAELAALPDSKIGKTLILRTAPVDTFQYPPKAKNTPAAELAPSVNRPTMSGVSGNGITRWLIGMEFVRLALAKIPSPALSLL